MNKSLNYITVIATSIICSACSPPDKSKDHKVEQGREETRTIRNTKSIGYSGNAIANKVDSALTSSEESAKKTEDALKEIPN